jgi:hypothetical protein
VAAFQLVAVDSYIMSAKSANPAENGTAVFCLFLGLFSTLAALHVAQVVVAFPRRCKNTVQAVEET